MKYPICDLKFLVCVSEDVHLHTGTHEPTGRLLLSTVPAPIMEKVETEDLTLFGQ